MRSSRRADVHGGSQTRQARFDLERPQVHGSVVEHAVDVLVPVGAAEGLGQLTASLMATLQGMSTQCLSS